MFYDIIHTMNEATKISTTKELRKLLDEIDIRLLQEFKLTGKLNKDLFNCWSKGEKIWAERIAEEVSKQQ